MHLKERTRFSQLSASFFFVGLFAVCSSSSPSNFHITVPTSALAVLLSYGSPISNVLWVHFLQIFLHFPSFFSNFCKLVKRSVAIFFFSVSTINSLTSRENGTAFGGVKVVVISPLPFP